MLPLRLHTAGYIKTLVHGLLCPQQAGVCALPCKRNQSQPSRLVHVLQSAAAHIPA
jgi:hypothetical protein